MSFQVNYYDPENPMMEITIADRRISFSVASVTPDARDWLGGVLDGMFHKQIEIAVNTALNEHRAAMRKLIGIQP